MTVIVAGAQVPLSRLEPGETAVVERLDGRPEAMMHLLELGLFPGETVRVVRAAPGGDPLELEVMGYRLAIRREEAAWIMVRPDAGDTRAG